MVNTRQTPKAKTGLTPPRNQQNKTNNTRNTTKNKHNNNINKDNNKHPIGANSGFIMDSKKKQPPSAATSTSSAVARAGGKHLARSSSKWLDTNPSIRRYLTPPNDDTKTSRSSLEHISESDEKMLEQEEEEEHQDQGIDDKRDDLGNKVSTQPPVVYPKVIDLMDMAIDLETVTPTQDSQNTISREKSIQASVSPTQKSGNQLYQHALKHGVPGKTAQKNLDISTWEIAC
jgi:hypothetical protein